MELIVPLGLFALILVALIRALLPTPQPPRVIYIQAVAEPEAQPRNGCLGGIILLVLVTLLLVSMMVF